MPNDKLFKKGDLVVVIDAHDRGVDLRIGQKAQVIEDQTGEFVRIEWIKTPKLPLPEYNGAGREYNQYYTWRFKKVVAKQRKPRTKKQYEEEDRITRLMEEIFGE